MKFRGLKQNFHQLLNGDVVEWFWSYRRQHQILNWESLKSALLSKYHRFVSDYEIQGKIMERRQKQDESVEEFYNAIMTLKNQFRVQILDTEVVRMVKDNLK